MKKEGLTFLFSCMLFLNSFAQWTPTNGPQGGRVWNLFSYNNYIFSSVSWAGVFRTSDMGNIWESKPVFFNDSVIYSFTVYENKILACGSPRQLYISSNNGNSWSTFGTPLPYSCITKIAIKDNNIFVAIPGYGIYRSSNNGTSWTAVNSGLPTSYEISDIKTAGNSLIVSYYDNYFGGIFRSTNNGEIWERTLNTHMASSGVSALEVDNNNVNRIFAVSEYLGVIISTNNGVNWSSIGGPNSAYYIAFSDPYLFVGKARTTNLGTNWTYFNINIGSDVADVFSLTIQSGIVFAGTDYWGIYKSTNWGNSWEPVNNGINGTEVTCLELSNNSIFAGTFATYIFRTTDWGWSWVMKNNGLQATVINALALRDNYVYAGTSDYQFGRHGVFISSDQGNSWRFTDSTYECEAIVVMGNCIFAGTRDIGVRRSTDNGYTWANANNGLPALHVVNMAVIDTIVFASVSGPPHGLYRSTNKGLLWTSVSNQLPPFPPDCIKANGQNLYISVRNEKFYSSNYGDSWVPLGNTNEPFRDFEFYQNHIFGATRKGVYHSSDNGYHWRIRSDGLINKDIYSLVIANGYLYAGSYGASVWKISIPEIIGISNISSKVPENYNLYQNYPNPFNAITNIEFDVPQNAYVKITIYDITGRIISTPVNESLNAGSYRIKFEGTELSSGVYFYNMRSDNFVQTKKMLLLK